MTCLSNDSGAFPAGRTSGDYAGGFGGVWIKVVKIFLEGGGARLGVLAAIASDDAA
jgi:hypothetical protein